jgi:hypothetical protein
MIGSIWSVAKDATVSWTIFCSSLNSNETIRFTPNFYENITHLMGYGCHKRFRLAPPFHNNYGVLAPVYKSFK